MLYVFIGCPVCREYDVKVVFFYDGPDYYLVIEHYEPECECDELVDRSEYLEQLRERIEDQEPYYAIEEGA